MCNVGTSQEQPSERSASNTQMITVKHDCWAEPKGLGTSKGPGVPGTGNMEAELPFLP